MGVDKRSFWMLAMFVSGIVYITGALFGYSARYNLFWMFFMFLLGMWTGAEMMKLVKFEHVLGDKVEEEMAEEKSSESEAAEA